MSDSAPQTPPPGAHRLALDGEISIYNALGIKTQLLTAVTQHPRLELDLSAIVQIDTAGIQLLVLAKRESQRLGHTLQVTAHSDAVREVIDFYNMGAFFGDPVIIQAPGKE